jgi:hypothetical protein
MKVQRGRDGISNKTGIMCPTGCGNEVVYNGNYFCDNFDVCGWALVATGYKGHDKALDADLYRGLMANRAGNYTREPKQSWRIRRGKLVRVS